MTIAFVLGNGVSRQGIDLDQLRCCGKIYGCNALYREFEPDVLVATDRPIATAIQQSGYALRRKFYTRRPLPDLGADTVPRPYFGYSSGPIAAAVAALDGNQKIYMLGFDMGPSQNNQFNNVYAGTEFYKATGSMPTFTGNWVRQIKQIVQDFPAVEFVRILGATTAHIEQFDAIPNLHNMDLAVFFTEINTASYQAKTQAAGLG
jgi:hypothetical protein